MAQILLDHGANPNVEDNILRTPLHQVAAGRYESKEHGVRVTRLLLQCGVDVNAQDSKCETPLHIASASGRLEIVRVLLERATLTNDRGQNASHPGVEGKKIPPKIILVLTFFF